MLTWEYLITSELSKTQLSELSESFAMLVAKIKGIENIEKFKWLFDQSKEN